MHEIHHNGEIDLFFIEISFLQHSLLSVWLWRMPIIVRFAVIMSHVQKTQYVFVIRKSNRFSNESAIYNCPIDTRFYSLCISPSRHQAQIAWAFQRLRKKLKISLSTNTTNCGINLLPVNCPATSQPPEWQRWWVWTKSRSMRESVLINRNTIFVSAMGRWAGISRLLQHEDMQIWSRQMQKHRNVPVRWSKYCRQFRVRSRRNLSTIVGSDQKWNYRLVLRIHTCKSASHRSVPEITRSVSEWLKCLPDRSEAIVLSFNSIENLILEPTHGVISPKSLVILPSKWAAQYRSTWTVTTTKPTMCAIML